MKKLYSSNSSKPKNKAKQKLNHLVSASNRMLCKCRTVFPFTLFPNTVMVDQNKIDIVYTKFFFTKKIFTLMIDDVRTVRVFAGPLFASMHFEVVGYEQNPEPVNFLPRECAFRLRRIIMGITAAKRENIDLQQVEKSHVRQTVEEIGATQEEIPSI